MGEAAIDKAARAKAIMIQGTASGVGKTMLTIALCRIFAEDGFRVAPFKPQNMTANTALTAKGDEIAVSQFLQALAAGVEPDARMNPVILKPAEGRAGVDVILNGRPYGEVGPASRDGLKDALLPEILKAYGSLAAEYGAVVIEGAGSPVELNLNQKDIVNMGIAKAVNAPVLLVSDIDRGGVFAALYGTVGLLAESERAHVKGLVVNRFRGDPAGFLDGKEILERITGLPVAGVVPYIPFRLPEEDSFGGDGKGGLVPSAEGETAARTGEHVFDPQNPAYEEAFARIATEVRKALDMGLIYRILDGGM